MRLKCCTYPTKTCFCHSLRTGSALGVLGEEKIGEQRSWAQITEIFKEPFHTRLWSSRDILIFKDLTFIYCQGPAKRDSSSWSLVKNYSTKSRSLLLVCDKRNVSICWWSWTNKSEYKNAKVAFSPLSYPLRVYFDFLNFPFLFYLVNTWKRV